MKLCKDCKYQTVPPFYGFGQPLMCSHPKAPIDPVTGNMDGSCSLMRSRNCCIEKCGFDGDWFEQALPPEPYPEMQKYVAAETVIEKSAWERIKHWFI